MTPKDLKKRTEMLKMAHPLLRAKLAAVQNVRDAQKQAMMQTDPKYVFSTPVKTASTVEMNGEHPMASKYIDRQLQMQQNNYERLKSQYDKELALLKQEESKMKGGVAGGGSPHALEHNMRNLPKGLAPGNVGDINRVMWPFWFTTTNITLAPNTSVQGNITITQEAAFIFTHYTKAVFLEKTGQPGEFLFVDPDQADSSGKSNGLTFDMRDSQSSRSFMNVGLDLNQIGYWKYPTWLPTPQLFLPNSNIEFNFQNNTNDRTYKPFITMHGLRVRIEHAKDILSTISG